MDSAGQLKPLRTLHEQWVGIHQAAVQIVQQLIAHQEQLSQAALVHNEDTDDEAEHIFTIFPGLRHKLLVKMAQKQETLMSLLFSQVREMRRCYLSMQQVRLKLSSDSKHPNVVKVSNAALNFVDALAMVDSFVREIGKEFLQKLALVESIESSCTPDSLMAVLNGWEKLRAVAAEVEQPLWERYNVMRELQIV